MILPTGGGMFDQYEAGVYFIAADLGSLDNAVTNGYRHVLVAVNELGDGDLDMLIGWAEKGAKVFLDSGIFNLTNVHARRHNVSMDTALALAPEDIDGFDELRNRYVRVVKKLHRNLWGFVELDQGGMVHKRRIRAELEDELGTSPIPVYHPFNDGWDYHDELAERYDRMCFGNVVQAALADRKRLAATAWERKRRYPHLWTHLLGFTPSPVLLGMPVNSCDSSTWLMGVRWESHRDLAALKSMGPMRKDFCYRIGADGKSDAGHVKARALCSAIAYGGMRNWRVHREALTEALGDQDYPPVLENEEPLR